MAHQSTPTIKDIAAASGVSFQTVSLALRGQPGVSERRRREIVDLAERMGYYPQASGQLLRRAKGRTGQWGLIVATSPERAFGSHSLSEAMGFIVDYCTRHSVRYVIEYHPYQADEVDIVPPHQVASGQVDGSLIIGDVGNAVRRWMDEQRGHPWVSLMEPARFSVLSADHRAQAAAVQSLYRLGHRRIACPQGRQDHLSHRLRTVGSRHALRRLNLACPSLWHNTSQLTTAEEHYDWACRVLKAPDRPTAIVCPDSRLARTAAYVAAELGLLVPRDLSLIAWAGQEDAAEVYPRLSRLDQDFSAIAEASIDLLKQRLEGDRDAVDRPRRWIARPPI